jgi:carbonyl reductase 1
MSNQARIAVVTGGNKGIGYSIVKGLAKQFQGIIYLTGKFFEYLLRCFC